jgi:hypothetical protein
VKHEACALQLHHAGLASAHEPSLAGLPGQTSELLQLSAHLVLAESICRPLSELLWLAPVKCAWASCGWCCKEPEFTLSELSTPAQPLCRRNARLALAHTMSTQRDNAQASLQATNNL